MQYTKSIVCFLCLVFLTLESKAEVYKCKSSKGALVYSASPCAKDTEAVAVKIAPASGDSSQKSSANANPIIGKWTSSIHVYDFRPGGSLRDEQYYGGKMIVWRTGSWAYKNDVLTLKFVNSGGQLGSGKMNYSESGKVNWDDGQQSFEIRLDGRTEYFNRK